MAFSSIFIGAPQSKYAALAILAAVLVVSFTLLFGKDPIPFTQKLAFVMLLFLVSLPGVLMTLFQMTCLVTGAGFRNQRWWCGAYAWIITVLLVVYCVLLIAVAIMSLTSGEKVLSEVLANDVENFEVMMKDANETAENFFAEDSKKEKFENELEEGFADVAAAQAAASTATAAPAAPAAPGPAQKPATPSKPELAHFKVAGGASEPASIPEPFEDASVELFTCASAY